MQALDADLVYLKKLNFHINTTMATYLEACKATKKRLSKIEPKLPGISKDGFLKTLQGLCRVSGKRLTLQ